MEEQEVLSKLADFFAILGDSTRMHIISLLRERSLNVSDIATILNMSLSAVSHQLKVLRHNDLVRTRRDGKYIYYRLSDEHVATIFDMGYDHILEEMGGNDEKDI